jgi:hypothetical protein
LPIRCTHSPAVESFRFDTLFSLVLSFISRVSAGVMEIDEPQRVQGHFVKDDYECVPTFSAADVAQFAGTHKAEDARPFFEEAGRFKSERYLVDKRDVVVRITMQSVHGTTDRMATLRFRDGRIRAAECTCPKG